MRDGSGAASIMMWKGKGGLRSRVACVWLLSPDQLGAAFVDFILYRSVFGVKHHRSNHFSELTLLPVPKWFFSMQIFVGGYDSKRHGHGTNQDNNSISVMLLLRTRRVPWNMQSLRQTKHQHFLMHFHVGTFRQCILKHDWRPSLNSFCKRFFF